MKLGRDVEELKKIVLIATTGIGNALVISGAVKKLKENFPDVAVSVVTSETNRLIYDRMPEVDEIFPAKRDVPSYLRLIVWLMKRRFDAAFLMYPEPRVSSAIVTFLSGIPVRVSHSYDRLDKKGLLFVFTHLVPNDPTLHDVSRDWNVLRRVFNTLPPLSARELKTTFCLLPHEVEDAVRKASVYGYRAGKFTIGIHAGCDRTSKWKRWSIIHFCRLAERICREFSEAQVIFFGGWHDLDLVPAIEATQWSGSVVNLIDKLSFLETASLISQCSYFVCNDSGLMQLASAMDVPLTAVMGPQDERRCYPLEQNSRVLRPDFDCSKCRTPEKEYVCVRKESCIDYVTVEDVLQSIKSHVETKVDRINVEGL